MPLGREVRRLQGKWAMDTGWPKRLDWIEIAGIRGWTGQRFELRFPIMAVVGENGVGKSTVLQAAASVYAWSAPGKKRERFASDFFPDTTWDHIRDAEIRYGVREGGASIIASIRKPTDRWRGNPQRRQRPVEYVDLTRVQPVPARTGYTKLANPALAETSGEDFENTRLGRFSEIMGRNYNLAKVAFVEGDTVRGVPVLSHQGATYSGFHQGAGETTVAELLEKDLPQYGLVVIDEIESSLHPSAQRRLIRDLAEKCRERELQVILTTHSPYVLDELPLEARACILQGSEGRQIIYGVSPEFAMTKMDDVPHHECDLYVEDDRAARMLTEILTASAPDLVERCQIVPCGAASVGQALGQMVERSRFPRPTCVFLDGDKAPAPGCHLLPGDDAPERVVFEALRTVNWVGIERRTGRAYGSVVDACERVMTLVNHHDWVTQAASSLALGPDTLWQAMCAEWATESLDPDEAKATAQTVEDTLLGIAPVGNPAPRPTIATVSPKRAGSANEPPRQSDLFSSAPPD